MQIQFTELIDSQWEVIEKIISHHKSRKHKLRTEVNAIDYAKTTPNMV
ncbi:MAG: hypothetical protein R3C61_22565 [Bacteroidia bacterium]